jgi:6-phosphogluconolactonase
MRRRAFAAFSLLAAAACGDDASSDASSAGSASTGPGAGSGTGATGSTGSGTGGAGGGAAETVPFVYVGTSADKIFTMMLDRETGELAPLGEIDAGAGPSFLAADPAHDFLYAINAGSSEVASFTIDGATGALTFLNRVSAEGSGPAHVSVDRSGAWVFVANYGSGHVASLAVEPDGSLGAAATVDLAGQNAHLILAGPDNAHVYVPCLGSNYVRVYPFDAGTGVLAAPAPGTELALPAGSGPRHLDFHPTLDVVYVVNELGDSVVVAQRSAQGTLAAIQTVDTLPAGFDGDQNACADIHVTPDGRYVYASNRGHNSLAIYSVDPATGTLTPLGHQSTGGDWPRNFSVDPAGEIVLVANQQSDNIVTFRIDPATGMLTQLVTTPTEGGPAFVGVITQPLP